MKKATIHIITGLGAGKTSSSLGIALRTVGHGMKAIIIQFLKGRKDIGEYLVKGRLSPEFELYQFGRPGWVNLHNPSKEDIALAKKGLKFAEHCLKKKPALMILDEINYAVAFNLVSLKDVLKLLNKVPPGTTVYLTGRFAPRELMERADYVTEVVSIKRPEKIVARKGIEW